MGMGMQVACKVTNRPVRPAQHLLTVFSLLHFQILQVQMNDYKYHYHMTTFDIEIFDLENIKYNFVNLTAFRLVDSSNSVVRHVLRDIERFSPKGKQILNKTNVIQVNQCLLSSSSPSLLSFLVECPLPICHPPSCMFHWSLDLFHECCHHPLCCTVSLHQIEGQLETHTQTTASTRRKSAK